MENDKVIVTKLPMPHEILRIYSGKPGCACGCRGKYYSRTLEIERKKGYSTDTDEERTAMFKTMLAKIYPLFVKRAAQGRVYSWQNSVNNFVVLDESPTRVYVLYMTR